MPFLQEKCFSFDNDAFDAAHYDRFDVFAARQPHRREQKLAFAIAGIDVDVWWLGALIRIKMKPPFIRVGARDRNDL